VLFFSLSVLPAKVDDGNFARGHDETTQACIYSSGKQRIIDLCRVYANLMDGIKEHVMHAYSATTVKGNGNT
jgi:hypothetical protein